MKKIMLLYWTILMICCGSGLYAIKAEAKNYNINHVDFYVSLESNGDAYVTEKWSVSYSGKYSRFYKDIHTKDLSSVEQFENIVFMDAMINTNNCVETTKPDERKNYTFSTEDYADDIRISWYYNAKNETVEYTINYILKKVIKATDKQKTVFSYRFIGAKFEKEIDAISITITPPSSTAIALLNVTKSDDWDSYINGKELILYNTKGSTGLVNVITAMNNCDFVDLEYVSLSEIVNHHKSIYKNVQDKLEKTDNSRRLMTIKRMIDKKKEENNGYTFIIIIISIIYFYIRFRFPSDNGSGGISCGSCGGCGGCGGGGGGCGGCGGGGAD